MNDVPCEEIRIQAFIDLQIGSQSEGVPIAEKIRMLQSRLKRNFILVFVNIGILLFFGYSFYFGITQLSETWLILIVVFFLVNVLILTKTIRRLKEAISWLERNG